MRERMEMDDKYLELVNGGELLDPVSGYQGDYEEIMKATALVTGDWIYDVFNKSGAAGVKAALFKKYGNKWFVKRFPVYDADGNQVA